MAEITYAYAVKNGFFGKCSSALHVSDSIFFLHHRAGPYFGGIPERVLLTFGVYHHPIVCASLASASLHLFFNRDTAHSDDYAPTVTANWSLLPRQLAMMASSKCKILFWQMLPAYITFALYRSVAMDDEGRHFARRAVNARRCQNPDGAALFQRTVANRV